MLGWHISIFRIKISESDSAGEILAVWQASLNGIDWVNELLDSGRAKTLSINCGYPNRYEAKAVDILPFVLNGPPYAYSVWMKGPDDILSPQWAGKTVINTEAVRHCADNEMLMIEVWDES